MSTIDTMFGGSVRQQIKRQFVMIRREKVDAAQLLGELAHQLQEVYNVTIQNKSEIVVKVDKKKNVPNALTDIQIRMRHMIPNGEIDSSLLFKVISSGNEIIIRVKRQNG